MDGLTHSAWWLICDAAAVYRLAVLLSKDKITDWLREGLRERAYDPIAKPRAGARAAIARWLFELIICPWCVSIWLGAIVVGFTRFVPGAWQYVAMLLTLSAAAGFFGERTDH